MTKALAKFLFALTGMRIEQIPHFVGKMDGAASLVLLVYLATFMGKMELALIPIF